MDRTRLATSVTMPDDDARTLSDDPNAPRALLAQAATAARALTVLPLAGARARLGESALFFPLVGLALGAMLVTLDVAGAGASRPARDVFLVAVLVLASGGRHLGALVREIAWITGSRGFGVAAAIGVLAVKLLALGSIAVSLRATALLLAPMLARWAMVVTAFGARARPGAPPAALIGSMTFREFALASVSAMALALVLADARALVAVLTLAAATIGTRLVAHRAAGGIDGDLVGAVPEVAEALVLIVFAMLGASLRGGASI